MLTATQLKLRFTFARSADPAGTFAVRILGTAQTASTRLLTLLQKLEDAGVIAPAIAVGPTIMAAMRDLANTT